jgi:membrane protease YdiL (CAAX protease family)
MGEELLFRGVVQNISQEWLGPLGGLALASVLFGLVHPLTRAYFVAASVIGVYLGWLWLATDNLLVPIIAHGLYDFVILMVIRLRRREKSIA